MAGRPKKRAREQAEKSVQPSEDSNWAENLAKDLMTGSNLSTPQLGDHPGSKVLANMADADREFLEDWWRKQLDAIELEMKARAEMIAMAGVHPNQVFSRQVLQLAALGMPKDTVAILIGLSISEMLMHYGEEYVVGAARVVGQAAANLLRIATSTNDRVAYKAAVEVINRRGGEEWRPPAQKIEVATDPNAGRNLIDSSKLTFDERQALRAIIERAVTRQALPRLESEDGDESAA